MPLNDIEQDLCPCFGKEDLEDQDEEDSKKQNDTKIDATKDVNNSPLETQIDPLISDDLHLHVQSLLADL